MSSVKKARPDDLGAFLTEFDKKTLLPLVPLLGITFVLDSVFSLQPPWPQYSTYATAFFELCTLFIAFFTPIRSKKKLLRWQIFAFVMVTLTFVGYFVLYSFFVFETPLTGERVVAGFQCTRDAALHVAPAFGETCPFLTEEVLSAAQYEAELVWTAPSVRTVETAMFLTWSGFFVFATFLFGISVAYMSRLPKRSA
ncbi:MAG: hypothetical protein AAFR32_07680 [Pseudomonadota bacterium]